MVNFHEETTTKEDLEMLFKAYGKLVRIDMKRNYAFVQFETIDQATRAKEGTNGGKIDQSVLTVEYVARQRNIDQRGGSRGRDRGGGRIDRFGMDDRRGPPPPRYDDRRPYYGGPPPPRYDDRRRYEDDRYGRGRGRSPSPPPYRRGGRSRSRSPRYGRSRSPPPRRSYDDDDYRRSYRRASRSPSPPRRGPSPPEDRDFYRGDRDRDRGYRG